MQLVIDGKRVVLSEGTSVELYSRNPFFTKEGEYSLDIDIDLREPGNAALYKNMQRADIWHRPVGRSAVLYNETGILIRGTEVVLEIDGEAAKIQIVGGNSELNYIAGGDKTLRSLDLGGVGELTKEKAMASLKSAYPHYDYVCAPVLRVLEKPSFPADADEGFANVMMDANVVTSASVLDSEKILNRIVYPATAEEIAFAEDAQFQALPYLCAIIRRVYEALGLTVAYNVLEETEFRQSVIVHSYRTDKYAEMLENWSVIDFINQYEYLCGVVTLLDGNNVSIVNAASFYQNGSREIINSDDVMDSFNKKFDQSRSERSVVYRNVKYNFPSSTLCKFYDPGKDTLERMEVVKCQGGVYSPYSLGHIWDAINQYTHIDNLGKITLFEKEAYKSHKLYENDHPQAEPLFRGKRYVIQNIASWKLKQLQEVGQFAGHYDDRTEDSVELKLCPAELYWAEGMGEYESQRGIPVVFGRNGSGESPDDVDADKPGVSIVLQGYSEEARPADTMGVAFYFGMQKYIFNRDMVYPVLSPSDVTTATFKRTDENGSDAMILNFPTSHPIMTLELLGDRGLYERYYKDRIGISETTEYTFNILHHGKRFDPRRIFIIGHKRYYCKELKYKVTDNKLSDIAEGVFYPAEDS